MNKVLKHKYALAGILIYLVSVAVLCTLFNQPLVDFIPSAILFVFAFPLLSFALTLKNKPLAIQPAFRTEPLIIAVLILLIVCYVTFLSSSINKLLPDTVFQNQRFMMFFVSIKKLLFFVFTPWLLYKLLGFSTIRFGFLNELKLLGSRKNVLIILLFSILLLAFQLMFSHGGEKFLSGNYSVGDYLIGLPLTFIYLVIDVGLVEEFFFRRILTSRIGAVTKSNAGGVLISAIIFGLIHAPGLFLRGAESEGIEEALPFIFYLFYTLAYMAVGGVFLGILYNRTGSLFLVIFLHSCMDLIPNFNEFVEIWLQ